MPLLLLLFITWFFLAAFWIYAYAVSASHWMCISPSHPCLANNTVMWLLLHAMLLTEASGFVNACYPIMWLMDWAFNMEEDPLHFQKPGAKAAEASDNAGAPAPEALQNKIVQVSEI